MRLGLTQIGLGGMRFGGGVPAWVPSGASTYFDAANDRVWADGQESDFATATSFTRATSAWGVRLPSDLAAFSSGAIRRDGNGVLVEGASTRRTGYPATPYTNWAATGATTNQLAGTDFGLFSDMATVISGGATWNRIQCSGILNLVSGTTYGLWMLYRAGTSGKAMIDIRDNTAATETLIAGNCGSLAVTQSNAGSIANLRETTLGDDRYLVEAEFTANASNSYRLGFGPYSAVNGETAHVAGGMLESSTSPTSIILGTATSQIARNAEVLTASVSNVRAIAADFVLDHMPSGDQVIAQADDGTANNRARIVYIESTGKLRGQVTVGGVAQCDLELDDYVIGTNRQAALSWAEDSFGGAADGQTAVTDASGSDLTGITTLRFGHGVSGADQHSVRILSTSTYSNEVQPDAVT